MNKLEQAMEDQKQGKWEKADKSYLEILHEEPDSADVYYFLATSQMSQNKLEEALSTINKALELEEQAPSFNQLKGSILARMGKNDEALVELKKAIKGNPNLYQSYIVIGHIYYTKGNRSEAEKHFKLAIKIDSKQPEGQVNLARILLDDGEVEAAINILKTVEEEHPDQATVKMMMGQAFIENGAYSYAENYFQKVLAMHPDYDLAGLYLGITKLYTGDMKNAEKLISVFNKQYPNTREGIAATGLFNFKNNRFGVAAEFLRKAIGSGLSPLSWRAAFVESLARMGTLQPAVDFYKNLEKKLDNKAAKFRLGELYEMQSKTAKAKKQYKKTKKEDSKYIASLLGMARIYLVENNPEKAEKVIKKILENTSKHAEATLLLITSLLFQNKQEQVLNILNSINYSDYNEVYQKTFRLQHGLVLDNQKEYDKAMDVFMDTNKFKMQDVQIAHKLSEGEVKQIKKFNSKVDDDTIDPVFIIGAESTGINDFALWLNEKGINVLNDRLVSMGRPDILYSYQKIEDIEKIDDAMVQLERELYHQKIKVYMNGIEDNTFIADCMYINPTQMALVKKFFPDAQIVLLNRDTADVWLNQRVFGPEPVKSNDWNETVNQIISMDLNLIQVDYDLWQQNDSQTLNKLSQIFKKELGNYDKKEQKYWRKTHFKKGHWKNYKKYLGA
jgi:tetratricopeptide (TPR) repeat protein